MNIKPYADPSPLSNSLHSDRTRPAASPRSNKLVTIMLGWAYGFIFLYASKTSRTVNDYALPPKATPTRTRVAESVRTGPISSTSKFHDDSARMMCACNGFIVFLYLFFSSYQTTSLFILNQSILDMAFYPKGLVERVRTSTHWWGMWNIAVSPTVPLAAPQRDFIATRASNPGNWITAGSERQAYLYPGYDIIGFPIPDRTWPHQRDQHGKRQFEGPARLQIMADTIPSVGLSLQELCGFVTFKINCSIWCIR